MSPLFHILLLTTAVLIIAANSPVTAEEPPQAFEPIKFTDQLPRGWKPINYPTAQADDAVARLRKRVETGDLTLQSEGPNRYLRSVLDALDIPVSSQLLVFSRTALNQRIIRPYRPRAIFFNEDVYVGWVPGAHSLEIAATDNKLGSVFYRWPNRESDTTPIPRRDDSCLTCHASSSTLHVPGLMVRSFQTDSEGRPVRGFTGITHDSPYDHRWGGWYVTGTHGDLLHLGNHYGRDANDRHFKEPDFAGNLVDVSSHFDGSEYLSTDSDLVAQLVFNHQTHAHNLITRVSYEYRLGRRSDAEERLFRYLLFVDEPELPSPIQGTTDFADWFASRGRRDKQGRSLRDLDLKTRLLKYRLSWLIGTDSFQALPQPVKQRFDQRLNAFLAGENPDPAFAKIPLSERNAIRELLGKN